MKVLGIDQSLNGTGLCIFDTETAEPSVLESFKFDKEARFDKVRQVCNRVNQLCVDNDVQVVAMEDYARNARSSSLPVLIELGGCIKLSLWSLGFEEGKIGQNQKAFFIQNQSNMKKFVLGRGDVEKGTGYLLEVFKILKREFKNDNEADAYMHAFRAAMVMKILADEVQISNLPIYQQEALISRALKEKKNKGLSLAKAVKLAEAEKRALLRV